MLKHSQPAPPPPPTSNKWPVSNLKLLNYIRIVLLLECRLEVWFTLYLWRIWYYANLGVDLHNKLSLIQSHINIFYRKWNFCWLLSWSVNFADIWKSPAYWKGSSRKWVEKVYDKKSKLKEMWSQCTVPTIQVRKAIYIIISVLSNGGHQGSYISQTFNFSEVQLFFNWIIHPSLRPKNWKSNVVWSIDCRSTLAFNKQQVSFPCCSKWVSPNKTTMT